MTTIRHGEPCALRTRMRSAERGSKSVSFYAVGVRWYHAAGLEGGVRHWFWLRCTTAVFVYLTHPPVVSQFVNAILRPKGRMMAGTRATPPQKWGVMRSQKEVRFGTPLFDRLTGRSRPHLSLREGPEQPPQAGLFMGWTRRWAPSGPGELFSRLRQGIYQTR